MKSNLSIKAVFRRSDERSILFNPGGCKTKDRSLCGVEFRLVKQLKISFLLICLTSQLGFSQKTNEKVYFSLIQDLWKTNSTNIDSITGFVPSELKSLFGLDSSASATLELSLPQIEFRKLEDGNFVREIAAEMVLTDSLPKIMGLTRMDTVTRKDLKEIRKSEYPELKGTDPRALQKYVWPGLGVGGGIAAIISLFYIRSSAQ